MSTNNRNENSPARLTVRESKLSEKEMLRRISGVSIVGNVLLSGFKLYAGFAGHSGAMVSDAVHSLSDVLTTFIALLGVRVAKKKADEDHPYGHEALESIASMVLAVLLILTGLLIGRTGVENIIHADSRTIEIPTLLPLIAAIVSIIGKEAMYWYTRHYARILNSNAFMADAWHHRSDALSSVGSLIGIAGAMMGFPVLDAAASVVICVFILKVGVDILKDAVERVTGHSGGRAFEKELNDFISAQDGVIRVDVLRSRMFGSRIYVDLEIEMDGNMTPRASHKIAESIHHKVEQAFPSVKHIMIHVNPA